MHYVAIPYYYNPIILPPSFCMLALGKIGEGLMYGIMVYKLPTNECHVVV